MEKKERIILFGVTASLGVINGKIFKITNPEVSVDCPKGSVIVSEYTTIHLTSALHKCSGIITEIGGITSHASIVSRELGIPCLINCKDALKKLNNGMNVMLNATEGYVCEL